MDFNLCLQAIQNCSSSIIFASDFNLSTQSNSSSYRIIFTRDFNLSTQSNSSSYRIIFTRDFNLYIPSNPIHFICFRSNIISTYIKFSYFQRTRQVVSNNISEDYLPYQNVVFNEIMAELCP